MLSIFFFENKPSLFQNFSQIQKNLLLINKLYILSRNTHNFFKEYYADRDKNIKKILCCSVVLISLSNRPIKSLKYIFKKESIKQFFRSSTIYLTGCSIIHFTEGFFAYMTLKNTKILPIYRDPRGISSLLHEFKIDINEEDEIDEENNIEENHKNNISKSEIRSKNSNNYKKISSEIHEYSELSNKELLEWQKEFLTEEHKTELIKEIKASEETLNTQATRYKEELQSKMSEIEKMTSLMEISSNEIISLKKEIKASEEKLNTQATRYKEEFESKMSKIEEMTRLMEISTNEIISLKKEIKSLEISKEQELHTLKKALENEHKNFTQAQSQLKNQIDQKQENKINILTQEYKKIIIALEKALNEEKETQDNLLKTIEEKEKALFMLGLEMKKKNESVKDLKEQFKKLNNCWKEAKEKNNREAKASSLKKINLIPVNNDLPTYSDLSSLHRLETIKEQFGQPASL